LLLRPALRVPQLLDPSPENGGEAFWVMTPSHPVMFWTTAFRVSRLIVTIELSFATQLRTMIRRTR
jgi:hypothetical protein